ncbi:MAG: hypothetical protein ACRD17_03235 [Terriglobales bacterium]
MRSGPGAKDATKDGPEDGSEGRNAWRRARAAAVVGGILILAALAAGAQLPGRDPLTPSEADAMRSAAGHPGKRVQLLLQDAGQRLARLQSLQSSNLPGRLTTMHFMLREYREILDELDDNFDEWMSGHTTSEMAGKPKLKKPLDQAIAAEQGFLKTLTEVRAKSSPGDLETYRFAWSDARDATNGDIQDQQSDLVEIQHRKAASKATKKKTHKRFPFAMLAIATPHHA